MGWATAACWTLWLSGWDATCAESFGANGVELTGAMFEATEAALANTGPLADASTGEDTSGAANAAGLIGAFWKPATE